MKKISFGIRELDEIIGGGYYPGYVVLVAGHPGVGKTTFAANFLFIALETMGQEYMLALPNVEKNFTDI